MTDIRLQTGAMLLGMFCATVAHAQQPAVPKLVRFSGSFHPADGSPVQTIESVTLLVYRDQTGGDVLWREIQNVVVDADSRYSVLMGATQNEGMPLDLFASGEPRWLGVQFNRPGEAEQPRTLLVSVPYALKAADAETLGGKPASAYLLAAPAVGTDTARDSAAAVTTTSTTIAVKPKTTPASSGQPNYIGKFSNTTDLVNSSIYEVNGNVGIFTTAPAISLDVRTGTLPQMGIAGTTDYLTFFASDQFGPAIYWDPAKDMRFGKGGSGLYNPFGFVEQMRIKSSNGNVGIGTQSPVSKLDVTGDINFSGSVLYQGTPVLRLPGGVANGNTATGLLTLIANTAGATNTATGYTALQDNTTGSSNTASGYSALFSNTTGNYNTASGVAALGFNTTGSNNVASGYQALIFSTTGSDNVATGYQALKSNSTGSFNMAEGSGALQHNTTGGNNTASGATALASNTFGSNNTADGYGALFGNTTGLRNTANGAFALQSNTTGDYNTASGVEALAGNTTGHDNTAVGDDALGVNTTGSNNIAIGSGAGSNVSGGNGNNIHIGAFGSANDNATIRIGDSNQTKFYAAGVRGVTTVNNNAIPVVIDSAGQLGTVSSSRRFKEDIQDMGAASHDLLRLRPVTYRYKQPFADGSKPIQYGLIAEEVAEIYPDLVAHSADGQIETVKYQVLDSMILNEVQRLERENEGLRERLARLENASRTGKDKRNKGGSQ